MDAFAQQLESWQVFYSTVSLSAVTLVGLLFVSLSLRMEKFRKHHESLTLRLARGSFGDFLYLLMLGLVFLVPHQAPLGLAIALLVLGLSRGLGVLNQLRLSVLGRGRRNTHLVREIVLPSVVAGVLAAVAVEVARGDMTSLFALVIVIAALLTSASWNAWQILVEGEI
jgi:hypothetical protein